MNSAVSDVARSLAHLERELVYLLLGMAEGLFLVFTLHTNINSLQLQAGMSSWERVVALLIACYLIGRFASFIGVVMNEALLAIINPTRLITKAISFIDILKKFARSTKEQPSREANEFTHADEVAYLETHPGLFNEWRRNIQHIIGYRIIVGSCLINLALVRVGFIDFPYDRLVFCVVFMVGMYMVITQGALIMEFKRQIVLRQPKTLPLI